MTHRCHWPGCLVEVPPAMWGCRPHWFRLPRSIRRDIWAAYRAGQEISKTPSAAYLAAARAARAWIEAQGAPRGAYKSAPWASTAPDPADLLEADEP